MNNTMKWILAVVVIIAVMLGIYGTISYFKTDAPSLGMNMEDYDSYIKYNGGINTALPITTTGLLTSGTFTAGATTLTGALIGTTGAFSGAVSGTNITGSGNLAISTTTTTYDINIGIAAATSSVLMGGPACFAMRDVTGVMWYFSVSATGSWSTSTTVSCL